MSPAEPPAAELIDHWLESATAAHRAGNLPEARHLYDRVLAVAPHHPVALFRSGLCELQEGRPEVALERVDAAARANPDDARYRFGLGQTLQALRRWHEAASAFESALRLDPDFTAALPTLALCLHRGGNLAEAIDIYRRALIAEPAATSVMANLGAALWESGATAESVQLLRAAAEREPHVTSHAVNLGMALRASRDFAAAEEILRRVLDADAANPEALFNLGISLSAQGKAAAAVDAYRSAIASRPGYTDALINLGKAQGDLGEFTAALAAYDAALASRPDSVAALNNKGSLLRTLGRIDEAEAVLQQGLQLDAAHAALHNNLGSVYKDGGRLDAAIHSFRRALELDPNSAATHSNLAYALSFQAEDPAPILDECRRWNARFAAPLATARGDRRAPRPTADADRRLRIGYVSADFRDHCQSLFTIPLLSRHDHAAFEIYCYSSVSRPDDLTARIAGLADVWRDVRHLDDAELAARIEADGIDILVDLTMHMANGRPLLFARKPAPLQISWLAYPGTTGIEAIDYRLSDPRLDPERLDPQAADADYSERTLRLADSFWCYDPLTTEPAVNPLPALTRGHLTLGCLNNPCKLTDRTLELWSHVMQRLSDARLVLMTPAGGNRRHLLQRLANAGVAAARIEFTDFRPRPDYLRSYHDIDLGLDTLPYNGHTTTLDSLWMGVPVVTRVGGTCAGRAGASQLHHVGLLELAADSDAGFVDAAVALGTNLPRLSALRQELRPRLTRSPLMDAPRFAREIEGAYRRAWENYCRDSIG